MSRPMQLTKVPTTASVPSTGKHFMALVCVWVARLLLSQNRVVTRRQQVHVADVLHLLRVYPACSLAGTWTWSRGQQIAQVVIVISNQKGSEIERRRDDVLCSFFAYHRATRASAFL